MGVKTLFMGTAMDIYEKVEQLRTALGAVRPFKEPKLKRLRNHYRVGLIWSSNAFEGNSLTEAETKVVLKKGLTTVIKSLREIHEVVGHGKAYDYVFSIFKNKEITVENIKAIHKLFYQVIDKDEAGVWRKDNVIVSGTGFVFPPAGEIDSLMEGLITWINTTRGTLHPLKFAALLHLKFVTIHPFIGGNGQVAQLLTCLALIQDGYVPALIPPTIRPAYLKLLRSYQQKGADTPFCEFVAERVYESHKDIAQLFNIDTP